MGATNLLLDATNQVAGAAASHTSTSSTIPTNWALLLWVSAVFTSSLAGVLVNQAIERRKNRLRLFKMEKVDYHNIHTGPAQHRGKHYNSVRCATYRLKNS